MTHRPRGENLKVVGTVGTNPVTQSYQRFSRSHQTGNRLGTLGTKERSAIFILKLRDYQEDIIGKTYYSMTTGHKRPLVVLPTGGGKTVCFAWMADAAQRKGSTVWFLVHRRELFEQTEQTFEKFNIPTDEIYIGMVGQVARNSSLFPRPDLIVFDEGHHASAATWQKITDQFPDAWIIGLTATPCRLDGKPLGKVYDDLVQGITTADLIQRGYLSDYRAYSVPTADTSRIGTKGKDFDMDEASDVMMDRAVYGDVIRHYTELAPGKRAICFCTTVRHSEAMAAEFRMAGINAVHFDGTTPKRQRKEIVERFRSGEIQILCNIDLVSEGFDISACDAVILLRPTQSLSLYLQQVGRALRPAEGKTAIILDHVGNALRHGLPDDQRDWSLASQVRSPEKFDETGKLILRTCTQCFGVYENTRSECPLCGNPYQTTREEIEQINSVQLKELKRREEAHRESWNEKRSEQIQTEQDCKTYNDLVILGRQKGVPNVRKWATSASYRLGIPRPWERGRR